MGKGCFWKRILAVLLILAVISTMVLQGNMGRMAAKAEGGDFAVPFEWDVEMEKERAVIQVPVEKREIYNWVQLVDVNGNVVSVSNVPVEFYDDNGNLIETGSVLTSEEGGEVKVKNVDKYTDKYGCAALLMESSRAATVRDITVAVEGYYTKFVTIMGDILTNRLDVVWIEPPSNVEYSSLGVQALAGEQVVIKAQLADRGGNVIRDSGVPVKFYVEGNNEDEREFVSEEGKRVWIAGCDNYTDASGAANLVLQSEGVASLRRVHVDVSQAVSGYYVKLIIGDDEVIGDTFDVSWLDTGKPIATPVPTLEPTPIATPTPTPTLEPTPIATPTPTPTLEPSPIATPTPTPTLEPTPIATPTPTPTLEPTPIATPTPTLKPTPTVKPTPTPIPGSNNLEDLNDISCWISNTVVSSGWKRKPAVKITWTVKEEAYKYQIYRSEAMGEEKLQGVCDASHSSFIDKTVKKGVRYYYKVRALGGTVQNSYKGEFSDEEEITIPSSLIKPVISHKNTKKEVKVYFKKAEGNMYQMQYIVGGGKKWKNYRNKKGRIQIKIDSKVPGRIKKEKIKKKGTVKIRIRTAMKVNGKQVYSKWSSTITVKAK